MTIDDLSTPNRMFGHGAGDWLLERMGILARQFFRTHACAVRHGGAPVVVSSIALDVQVASG